MEASRLAPVEDVPPDGTAVYILERDGETREVLLTRLADGSIAAWENHCQHWIDVRLDRGDGATVRGDEIVCQRHGAMFERATGLCTWGPCEGAVLDEVAVVTDGDVVYLDEPEWTVVGPGVADDGGHDDRGGLDH